MDVDTAFLHADMQEKLYIKLYTSREYKLLQTEESIIWFEAVTAGMV